MGQGAPAKFGFVTAIGVAGDPGAGLVGSGPDRRLGGGGQLAPES